MSLPTKEQVEKERKLYRWKKAYINALTGTIRVLTMVAAVAALIATLVLPVLQIEGTSMEPTLKNGDIVGNCHLLGRRECQLHAPTLGPIRLGVNAHHIKAVCQDFRQAGGRDVRGSHKYTSH